MIECKVKPSCRPARSPRTPSATVPPSSTAASGGARSAPSGARTRRPRASCRVDPRVEVLGASSDHLILDVEALEPPPRLGDPLAFVPGYGATLQLCTSPYVHKVFTPPA